LAFARSLVRKVKTFHERTPINTEKAEGVPDRQHVGGKGRAISIKTAKD